MTALELLPTTDPHQYGTFWNDNGVLRAATGPYVDRPNGLPPVAVTPQAASLWPERNPDIGPWLNGYTVVDLGELVAGHPLTELNNPPDAAGGQDVYFFATEAGQDVAGASFTKNGAPNIVPVFYSFFSGITPVQTYWSGSAQCSATGWGGADVCDPIPTTVDGWHLYVAQQGLTGAQSDPLPTNDPADYRAAVGLAFL